MSTRRQALEGVHWTPTTHAGLWLDRFIRDLSREDKESRHDLVKDVADIPAAADYTRWFERWQQALRDAEADCRNADTSGRMVVGLGMDGVLDVGVALHHTYGVPYIPGSALKGLAASYARQRLEADWQVNTPAYITLFGDMHTAGYVTFFDALPVPGAFRLWPDVIAVHHQDYYGDQSDAPPADWDDPNPVPFLSTSGKFLLALAGPPQWIEAAYGILEYALREAGIGARTSSGYGRMQLKDVVRDPSEGRIDALVTSIEALKNTQVASGIYHFYERWTALDASPAQRKRVAAAIVAKVKSAGREKQTKDKDWYQKVVASQ